MFRSKVFEPTITGISYRIFIEDLKSAVTKAAYTFAIQKYMKSENRQSWWLVKIPRYCQIHPKSDNWIFDLPGKSAKLIKICNKESVFGSKLLHFDLNEVILNKKKINRYLGEEEKPIENWAYTIEEIARMLEVYDERVKALITF